MNSLNLDRCVVRNTAARKGRSLSVTPATTAARHLHYGRIILDAAEGIGTVRNRVVPGHTLPPVRAARNRPVPRARKRG